MALEPLGVRKQPTRALEPRERPRLALALGGASEARDVGGRRAGAYGRLDELRERREVRVRQCVLRDRLTLLLEPHVRAVQTAVAELQLRERVERPELKQ